MSSFSVKTHISAPIETVWEVLADIGNIHAWHPGVINSHLTTEQTDGPGTARYCNLGGRNFLNELVVAWEPTQSMTVRITDTNLPFKTADIRFTLQEEMGGTFVEVSPVYQLKFGILGKALDALYVKKTYERGMQTLLRGLKDYIEQS